MTPQNEVVFYEMVSKIKILEKELKQTKEEISLIKQHLKWAEKDIDSLVMKVNDHLKYDYR